MQLSCAVASLWLEPEDLVRSQNQLLADSISRLAEENASLVNEYPVKPSIRRSVTDRSAAFGVFQRQAVNLASSKFEEELASVASTSAPASTTASIVSSLDSEDGIEDAELRTTLVIQNVPSTLTRDELVSLMNTHEQAGQFDLVYVPVDLNSSLGFGYAFVNFCSASAAEQFLLKFDGFSNWADLSDVVCRVKWNGAHQGLQTLVARYRNSPVMHPDVPDAMKPAMFDGGNRVPFPSPTKKLKAPNPRRSK